MANDILKPKSLIDFVDRTLNGRNPGTIKAAEVWIEYYDHDHMNTRCRPAGAIRMEQSEHGPVKIIISDTTS